MPTYKGLTFEYGWRPRDWPERLVQKFHPLALDEGSRAFIDNAFAAPHGKLSSVARAVAGKFVNLYDANGLVGTHSMHVLSEGHWRALLGEAHQGGRLLDIGAGDGEVTKRAKPLFDEIVTTELSGPMAKRLRKHGFECHEVDLAHQALPVSGDFDVVSAFNVIDRTTYPVSLLRAMRGLARDGGRIILSVPLPLSPIVFVGTHSCDPEEPLPVGDDSFEASLLALLTQVIEPMGLEIERLARVPYLCRSTAERPITYLDDAVVVCRVQKQIVTSA